MYSTRSLSVSSHASVWSMSLQSVQLGTITYTKRASLDREPEHSLFSRVIHERPAPQESDMNPNQPITEVDAEKEQDFEGEDSIPALLSTLPVLTPGQSPLSDVGSANFWFNPNLWRAGLIEAGGSACLAFLSGELGATLSRWPVAAIPAGIFFGNTALVSLLIYAAGSTSGAHVNPNVTISAYFCGICHPVRAAVYIFCQIVGGIIGGAFLRAALGETRAVALHNGGCWIDPAGGTTIGQAVSMEFMSTFCLLYLAYGVGLDPRQGQTFGPILGPLLVGLLVGTVTSFTATVSTGYTGAGMFPARCLGLAVGMGVFQNTHWLWWIPDIVACFVHSLMYRLAPPFRKEYTYGSPQKPKRTIHEPSA